VSHSVPTRPFLLLLQEPLLTADRVKALFDSSSDSDEDEVVEDTQRAATTSAMPAVGRVVAGLRAPAEGRAPPDAPAPSPPSQADAATQEEIGSPKPRRDTEVLDPWPEDEPERPLVCAGCVQVIRMGTKTPVGICPDCHQPVHNNKRRDECIKMHAGRRVYACSTCVNKAGEKATSSKRLSSARVE
jgi:uncharacterized CHY-type Zn-finger protein